MVEHKCDKCNYLAADKAALAQHLQRKTPCDEGKYLCKHCAKPLKSKDTLRNHEKACSGPKKTREELQLDNTILHAQMSMQADASNQQMAIASNASTLAAKAVYDIMSQPHKEYDANQLVLHQPVGSENTSHLKGSSLCKCSDHSCVNACMCRRRNRSASTDQTKTTQRLMAT
jgi:hypothetical protein